MRTVPGLNAPARLTSLAAVRQDPERAIAELESAVLEARSTLRAAGVLTAQRLATVTSYLQCVLGEGNLVREDPNRDGIRLPRGTQMYTVRLGGIFPHVVLERETLTLVAVDLQ